MTIDPAKLLTVEEFAVRLGMSGPHIRKLVKQGLLTPLFLGKRCMRFTEDEFYRYMRTVR